MPMYSEKVLDHFTNPRNAGEMADADAAAQVSNPQCGDTLKMYIQVAKSIILDCRWQTMGCSGSIAASSVASEMVKGKTLSEAARLTSQAIAAALGGLPPAKRHGAVLAADALRAVLKDYESRQAQKPPAARPSSAP